VGQASPLAGLASGDLAKSIVGDWRRPAAVDNNCGIVVEKEEEKRRIR